jgi:rhombotail lipoprotein
MKPAQCQIEGSRIDEKTEFGHFGADGGCACAGGLCKQRRVRQASSMPLDKVIETTKDSRVTAGKSPLTFPASVTILMVPASGGAPRTDLHQAAETLKKKLIENRKYIGSVSVVSTFDVSKKTTLEQVGASYAADVVILVFYQQYHRTVQSGPAALLDIAIVPAFTVPGVKVNTATLIEGVVAHIPSNAVIFRTSAYDERSAYSTSYSEANTAASTSVESFDAAMVNFGNDLSETLDRFDKFDVSKAPSISPRPIGPKVSAIRSRSLFQPQPTHDPIRSGTNFGPAGPSEVTRAVLTSNSDVRVSWT